MRIFLLLPLFFCACKHREVKDGVLSEEKTKAVLYDVIRTDEWVDFAALQDSTFRKFEKRSALYDSVFQHHGITKDQYRATMNFYQGRPDLLKELLADMKLRADSASTPKPQKDSLQKKLAK